MIPSGIWRLCACLPAAAIPSAHAAPLPLLPVADGGGLEALPYWLVTLPLLALLAVAFLWSHTLRRTVAARTRDLVFTNSLLRARSEASIDGVLTVDTESRVLSYNRRFMDMWGIPPDRPVQGPHEALLRYGIDRVENPDAFLKRVHEIDRNPRENDRETLALKDGRVIDRYTAPIIGPDGVYLGRVWFFRDITESRRAAQALEAAAEEARRMLNEAEQARRALLSVVEDQRLTSEKLRESEERIQQAQRMESIGRLAGGIAHDFNNMLSVILGNTELAMEGLDPAERRRADLLEVQNAARRAADLTRQLLAFARKQTVAPKVIDLNDSLADMVSMLRCLLGTNIELAFLPAAGLWPVKIDPSQVDQILTNLCVNAREAIRDAGRLTIGTANLVLTEASSKRYADADPGDYAVLTVSDTGCGMSKETLRHVFEPFFTTKYRRGGTGLGLATVYGIVKQNRGFIDVSSEPGRGTTFKIGFPRHPDDTPEPGPSSVSEAKPFRGTGSILLVEDDEALLDMTETMLEKLGYTVTAANSPQDALRLAGQSGGAFDLMITDIIMPGMNGFELARKLRLDFPKMKHLFMSGYTDSLTVHQDILDAGGHFIQKPFTLQDLSAKVWRALDNR